MEISRLILNAAPLAEKIKIKKSYNSVKMLWFIFNIFRNSFIWWFTSVNLMLLNIYLKRSKVICTRQLWSISTTRPSCNLWSQTQAGFVKTLEEKKRNKQLNYVLVILTRWEVWVKLWENHSYEQLRKEEKENMVLTVFLFICGQRFSHHWACYKCNEGCSKPEQTSSL